MEEIKKNEAADGTFNPNDPYAKKKKKPSRNQVYERADDDEFIPSAQRKHWVMDKEKLRRANAFLNHARLSHPTDKTNIRHNLLLYFNQAKGAELMTFMIVYSLPVLLAADAPLNVIQCWDKFVSICKIVISRVLHTEDVYRLEELTRNYHDSFIDVFGDKLSTANDHQMLHLHESTFNLGSGVHYWLFTYERWNNVLTSFSSNNKKIESLMHYKVMRRSILELAETQINDNFSKLYSSAAQRLKSIVLRRADRRYRKIDVCSDAALHDVYTGEYSRSEVHKTHFFAYQNASRKVYGDEPYPICFQKKEVYAIMSEVHKS